MRRMTIDNTCGPKPMSREEIVNTLKTMVFGVQAFERFNAKERETLDKAWNIIDQYETRLKADMAAMLTELSMTIGEIEDGYTEFDEENKRSLTMIPLESVDRLIQQKIDKLKAGSEDT